MFVKKMSICIIKKALRIHFTFLFGGWGGGEGVLACLLGLAALSPSFLFSKPNISVFVMPLSARKVQVWVVISCQTCRLLRFYVYPILIFHFLPGVWGEELGFYYTVVKGCDGGKDIVPSIPSRF